MSAIPCSSVSLKTMADGTLRLSIDFEPMHAQDAFKLFAAPGTPAAIAALQAGYAQADAPKPVVNESLTTEKPKGGPLAKLAGMWSADPEFWAWLAVTQKTVTVWDAEKSAEYIRNVCGVESRAELDHDPEAEAAFHTYVRGPFSKYLIARGIVR